MACKRSRVQIPPAPLFYFVNPQQVMASQIKVGVHVSISGRIANAVEQAVRLGCNTFQMFSRNPRSFKRKRLSKDDIGEFRRLKEKSKISPAVVHAVYTQNLASKDKRLHNLSIRDFIKDMAIAEGLGAELVVTHLGSYKGSSYDAGVKRVLYALDKILKKAPTGVTLLLENISGSGNWIGARFSEMAKIIDSLGKPDNLGICLDTCHAFCAGYDLKEDEGLNILVKEIDSLIGINKLQLIHLNDARDPLGSKRDRHADIGKGFIGKEGISRIINHPLLRNIPFVLEPPKESDEDDLRNIKSVRDLYKG
jgi:deoxyribonuclease IV